jgi:hypothetical protein
LRGNVDVQNLGNAKIKQFGRAVGGYRLGLSPHTIKNYLLKIFDKLGVCNRVELLFLTLSQPMSTIPIEGKRSNASVREAESLPKDKVNGEQKKAVTMTSDTATVKTLFCAPHTSSESEL